MADALQGTWVMKDSVSIMTGGNAFSVNFISKGIEYKTFTMISSFGGSIDYTDLSDSALKVYSRNVWTDPAYKTINITSKLSEVTNGEQLLTWLQENATKQEATRISIDLTTLPGWASLPAKTYNITIVARADGYKDSEPSAVVSVEKAPAIVMPNKGDIITLDSKQYRVLKTEGTVAEVLCMYDASTSVEFDSASSGYNNTYAGKSLDTYCNNTFYSGLSAAMKNAIIDKTFTQDSWKRMTSAPTESHYTGKYNLDPYYLTLDNAAYGSSIIRHCYCLSVQDVLDYLEATTSMGTSDTTLTDTNIWKMFWNGTTSQSTDICLRSAYSRTSDRAFRVNGGYGSLTYYHVNTAIAARPAFQIDLSKIAWSK